jgi:hypothetical protein
VSFVLFTRPDGRPWMGQGRAAEPYLVSPLLVSPLFIASIGNDCANAHDAGACTNCMSPSI